MAKTIIFEGDDLFVSFNEPQQPWEVANACVSFSAWSATGVGTPFSVNFLNSKLVPVYSVQQKSNHWWHTPEMAPAFEAINKHIRSLKIGAILYGASMGGYAAAHFRDQLDSWYSVALSPQLVMTGEYAEFESRWKADRLRIRPQFDEIASLKKQARYPLLMILDTKFELDYLHVSKSGVVEPTQEKSHVRIIDAEYTNHTTIRALAETHTIQPALIGLAHGVKPDLGQITEKCAELKFQHPKTFVNFLRNADEAIVSPHAARFSVMIQNGIDSHDFETLYMISECCLRFQMKRAAMYYSERSLAAYKGDSVPAYLYLKHLKILSECADRAKIASFWDELPPEARTDPIRKQVSRLLDKAGH